MRFIFNPSTGNLESADNVTSPLKTLGEKFKVAELTNMNTPDLEQSPDSFLRPGETLEDWDVTFRRPNAYGGLQRTGFANGPPKWSGTKNLPFNKRDAWRKNFVDKLVKWIIKKIKKFNKTALPGEVPNISVNNILRDMGYSPSEAAGTIRKSPPTTLRNYITEAFSKVPKQYKFTSEPYGFKTQVNPRKGEINLTDVQKEKALNFFRKNHKSMSITQMAEKLMRQLSTAGKKGYSVPVKTMAMFLSRFRDWLINKNVISMDDMFQGRGGLRPDVKIKKDLKFDPKWDNYRKDYMKLVKQDASIYKNPKFQNKKGKFLYNYFDDFLKLELLNKGLLDEALGPKWPAMMRPSFEHVQGITPGRILNDPSALRKVDLQTVRYNFENLGATSKNYSNVKQGLSQARKLLNKKDFKSANNALKIVNEIYDSVGKDFKLNRKELPKYKIINGQIKETNLKGIIKPQTIKKSFSSFFEKVANQANEAELKQIKKVNPAAYKVINEIKKGGKNVDKYIKVLEPKGTTLRSVAGAIPQIDISPRLGNAFKVLGTLAWPLEGVFAGMDASEAFGKGASGKDTAEYIGKRFFEGIANLPALAIAGTGWLKDKAQGKDAKFDMPYEFTFAQDALQRDLDRTPENVKQRRIAEIEFDNTMLPNMTMVDVMEESASKEDIEIPRDKFLKGRLGENYKKTHPKDFKEEVEIKETENVWGTPIPMKSITEGFSRDEFLAKGGRVGFADGTAHDDKSDEEILAWIKNQMFELDQGWNTGKSVPG